MCEIWNMTNSLSHYCQLLHHKIETHAETNDHIRGLFKHYQRLKKNDFAEKVKEYQKKREGDWYMEMHEEVEREILDVI